MELFKILYIHFDQKLNVEQKLFRTHAHNQLKLGNYSPESNHRQLFPPKLSSSAWYRLYVY